MNSTNRKIKASYELFILSLSILSIFNLFLYVFYPYSPAQKDVLLIMNLLLSGIFFIDVLIRLKFSGNASNYFFKKLGFIDLLSAIPILQIKILRIVSIFARSKELRETGIRKMFRTFLSTKGDSAILTMLFLIILVLQTGSVLVLNFESNVSSPQIQTAQEAMWWSFATITTVGYGDFVPLSIGGRLVGIVMMIVGLSLFGVLIGFLANVFSEDSSENDQLKNEIKNLKEEIHKLKS